MELTVIEPFYITGRGVVVTTNWPEETVTTGDWFFLPDGIPVQVRGIEMMGEPKPGKSIGLLLGAGISKEQVPSGTVLTATPVAPKQVRACAVDAVLYIKGAILLVKRKFEPYKDCYVLPGGFVDPDETVEQAVVREVKEETGVDVFVDELVGVYSNPDRDPRQNISIAFLCGLTKPNPELLESDETVPEWFSLMNLPELGFDHQQVIKDAVFLYESI